MDKLKEACKQARIKGYSFAAYPVDIADMADCDRFLAQLIVDHGSVDFLINNAGRSIRRAIESSYDRFHDCERTVPLKDFGSVRIIMGLLPGMTVKKNGHVVKSVPLASSPMRRVSMPKSPPRPRWTRCAASEFVDQGVCQSPP